MDIFKNPTKSIPTSDEQIIRVDMEQDDIQGRKSHLPPMMKAPMSISHTPNAGTTPGSK